MLKRFFNEIRRRNVIPTIVPYIVFVWLVLQIVVVIQPILNLHVLVSTFVAIFLFALFPVVLYLSWYFDFTKQGLVPIKNLEGEESVHFGKTSWSILFVIVLASGYLGYGYFDIIKTEVTKHEQGIKTEIEAKSIAVLPFRDQSPNKDQSFITQGITEEITNILGKESGLQVAASSSALALFERKLTPTDIGKRLLVDTIVTGSVRVTGNQLKIRTEILDTNNGDVLWTESFSRQFKDIFAVEEEIARSIVNLLEDRYLEKGEISSQARTAVTDAYVMYLKGREAYRKQTTESMKEARKYFEQAIALDPEYALAYIGLADTITMLAKSSERWFGHDAFFGIIDKDIASRLAHDNIAKALTRSPNLPTAYAIRGLVLTFLDDNYEDGLSAFDKALSLNPNLAIAHTWKFVMYDEQGLYTKAWETLQSAYALDPVSIANQYNRGFYLAQMGEFDKAIQQYKYLARDFPESPLSYAGLAYVYYNTGDLSESIHNWMRASELSPDNQNYLLSLVDTLTQVGMVEEAKSISTDSIFDETYLLLEKQYEALFERLDFKIKANPDDPWLLFEAGWYRLIKEENSPEDAEIGSELLLRAFELFDEQDLYLAPLCSPAIEIAWALGKSGKKQQADTILSSCAKQVSDAYASDVKDAFVDYTQARIFALMGRSDDAEKALNQAINRGWLQWWTSNDPLMGEVFNRETGNKVLKQLEQKLALEKEQASVYFD